MTMHKRKKYLLIAVAILATGITLQAVQADDDDREERGGEKHSKKYGGENRGKTLQPSTLNAKFQQECSSCHLAYAPGLLPAQSWRKIMSGLDKHFGSDAFMDAQDNKEITAFLVSNASSRWNSSAAPLRITETAWFTRKHDTHEISPSVWKNPKVKSPANCAACHRQADTGNFNEDDISIPR